MTPTLKNGEVVLIKKFNLSLNYNDIIVIRKNNKTIIKRIVGLPHDTIKIDKYLFVNGKKNEKLLIQKGESTIDEFALKADEYFVLGDNLQNSIDSRSEEIGIILKTEIMGKLLF